MLDYCTTSDSILESLNSSFILELNHSSLVLLWVADLIFSHMGFSCESSVLLSASAVLLCFIRLCQNHTDNIYSINVVGGVIVLASTASEVFAYGLYLAGASCLSDTAPIFVNWSGILVAQFCIRCSPFTRLVGRGNAWHLVSILLRVVPTTNLTTSNLNVNWAIFDVGMVTLHSLG